MFLKEKRVEKQDIGANFLMRNCDCTETRNCILQHLALPTRSLIESGFSYAHYNSSKQKTSYAVYVKGERCWY